MYIFLRNTLTVKNSISIYKKKMKIADVKVLARTYNMYYELSEIANNLKKEKMFCMQSVELL